MKLNILDLGQMDYKSALEIQYQLLEKRQNEEIGDTLILVEHPPVITLGKNALEKNVLFSPEFLLEKGISLYEIERGGDVTYHGYGQLVGYPIFNLRRNKIGIRNFVDTLEKIFIQVLQEHYQISAGKDPEHTGVWIGQEKIVAIGLAVKKAVTMHGFAFNINTDLSHFQYIIPCGIQDRGVTSIQKIKGTSMDFQKVKEQVTQKFVEHYLFDGIEYMLMHNL